LCFRSGVPLHFNSKHPQKSLNCQRLLTAAPEWIRPRLASALYKHYWQDDGDIVDVQTLIEIANSVGFDSETIGNDILHNDTIKQQLLDTTNIAVERGAFGVPFFWCVESQKTTFFWGQDRLHFVAKFFGDSTANYIRLTSNLSVSK
jgi:glutathione S-transferase kappa 1